MKQKEREDLRNALFLMTATGKTEFERGINYACDVLNAIISVIPAETNDAKKPDKDTWFKVSEHTPPCFEDVLGYSPQYENIYTVSYQGDGTFNYFYNLNSRVNRKCDEEITYWRPLPKMPEVDK